MVMKNFQNKAKIVKVSKILRTISFVGLVFLGLLTLFFLASALMVSLRLHFSYAFFTGLPMFVFAFITNWKLFRFFDRLKNGCFFDAKTVGNLGAAGTWWLMLWLYEIVYCLVTQSIYFEHFNFKNFPPDLGSLFAGLTLKFVAWLLREAQELQEEQELTV
jgi:hypothetical protein